MLSRFFRADAFACGRGLILGLGEDAAWSFPWKLITLAPGLFLKLVGVLVVLAILLKFVPFIGEFRSLQTLVLGGIALVFFVLGYAQLTPTHVQVTGSLLYDIDHAAGAVGPTGHRPKSAWEIHPVTSIQGE
jgi:hypothetical protein